MFSKTRNKDIRLSDQVAADSTPISRHRFPYMLWPIWIVWLPLLIPPILDLFRAEPVSVHLVVTVFCVVLFVSLYILGSWRNARELGESAAPLAHIPLEKWLLVSGLILLSVGIGLLGHVSSQWLDPFIFSSAYVSGSFRPRYALPLVSFIVLLSLITGGLMGLDAFDVIQTNIILVVTWVTTISLVRSFVSSRELHIAREEIARLAVTNERLRIARDLHDLLGHNLSLIALKSELARRLIDVSPERAATEIGDVEKVARTTLQEVREAVGQYRQPTLSSELHAAREILTAAGIEYQYEGPKIENDTFPSAIESTLSWVIREGVTNVIRHSRAHRCTIRVSRDRKTLAVEILDDGTAALKADLLGDGGNGLRGLRERITDLGGRCESGPQANGGFRLAVFVPFATVTHKQLPGTQINLPDGLEMAASSDPNLV